MNPTFNASRLIMTRNAKSILTYVFIGIALGSLGLSTIPATYYLLQVAHASSSEAATAAATGDAASAAATTAGASAAAA
ncbi:MAG: hypothetical protein ACRD4W_11450, partial [Nitrososphaeraceae archaeon]